MKKTFLILIKLYQGFVSPAFWHMGARCRFYPSCSEYAREAFEKLPMWRAFLLSFVRVLKCGPWHRGGVDILWKKEHC